MIRLKIGIFCLLPISLILLIASIKEHEAKSDIVVAVIDTKYNQCSFSEGNVWINKKEEDMWFSLLIMICFFAFVGIVIFGIKKMISLLSNEQIIIVRDVSASPEKDVEDR